jgi:hypothetical protein
VDLYGVAFQYFLFPFMPLTTTGPMTASRRRPYRMRTIPQAYQCE